LHESIRKPLAEQWRKDKYRWENGWAPIAYYSGMDKSADYFADFARFSATTNKGRLALLANESPQAAALFKTLLYRRSLNTVGTPKIYVYPTQIRDFSLVDNPLVEAEYRNYIITALSDPKHNDSTRRSVEEAVSRAILQRIRLESIDKEDFASWIASLPLPLASRNHALRMLRLRQDEALTFADRLQQAAGEEVQIETELTLDDVLKWFAENPEGQISKFFEEHEENISVTEIQQRSREKWAGLGRCLVIALLRSDTPEGNPQIHDAIQQIVQHSGPIFQEAMVAGYVMATPGRMGTYESPGSNNLPDYILDMYKETSDVSESIASILALCDSPKAGEILERWSEMASPGTTPRIERFLETWKTHATLRQKKVEIFQALVTGKMSPDDLLFPSPAWVWRDGQYVQVN
jgi:hypothetical protein